MSMQDDMKLWSVDGFGCSSTGDLTTNASHDDAKHCLRIVVGMDAQSWI